MCRHFPFFNFSRVEVVRWEHNSSRIPMQEGIKLNYETAKNTAQLVKKISEKAYYSYNQQKI